MDNLSEKNYLLKPDMKFTIINRKLLNYLNRSKEGNLVSHGIRDVNGPKFFGPARPVSNFGPARPVLAR